MRLKTCLGLFLLALAPMAHAQARLPTDALDLQFTAANQRTAMYFERRSIVRTDGMGSVWIFMAMPEAATATGGWYLLTVDCTARMVTASGISPVNDDFTVRPELNDTAKPTAPITPNSMDESLSKVLCDGANYNFKQPPVTSLSAAWTQAQEFFKSLAKPG